MDGKAGIGSKRGTTCIQRSLSLCLWLIILIIVQQVIFGGSGSSCTQRLVLRRLILVKYTDQPIKLLKTIST